MDTKTTPGPLLFMGEQEDSELEVWRGRGLRIYDGTGPDVENLQPLPPPPAATWPGRHDLHAPERRVGRLHLRRGPARQLPLRCAVPALTFATAPEASMSNVIPFTGKWKGASRAPNDARCCTEARAVACGNCSSHWICSWHGDRHAPEFIEPAPTPSTETPPRAPSQPNAPGFHLGPDECLACGKFDDCVCEECPSCDGTGDAVPGMPTCGPCSDCKGAGRIP